jgi:hypothetical protein
MFSLLEIPKQIFILLIELTMIQLGKQKKNHTCRKDFFFFFWRKETILVSMVIEVNFRTVLNRDCKAQVLSLQFSSFSL